VFSVWVLEYVGWKVIVVETCRFVDDTRFVGYVVLGIMMVLESEND
jgi:hypothetical protein